MMNCLEFKRLALSEPNSKDNQFFEHSKECSDCLKYVASVRKMDADLNRSLEVPAPSDLIARLQLHQVITESEQSFFTRMLAQPFGQNYAIAASFVGVFVLAGMLLFSQLRVTEQINQDYQTLLTGVTEHLHKKAFAPVWDAQRANRTTNILLASYDSNIHFKHMDNLQFSRICPMGKYHGLHATLQTDNGQVTFAYIKGETIGELLTTTYQDYVTRVKPVRGGNLVIISHNRKSLEQADQELTEAMYWDI